MSHSPSTPEQAKTHLTEPTSKVIVNRAEHFTSSSKSRQASLNEPSPASTYGETTIGSSTPATPLEVNGYAGIAQSMRVVQLDPAIASITGSPMPSQDIKSNRQSEQRTGHISYPGFSHNSSRRAGIVHVKDAKSAASSPTAAHTRDVREAQDWCDPEQGKFVRQSGQGSDDPFVSSGAADQSINQVGETTFIHHPDRIGEEPTNNTAQAILPPQACVFVANLTQSDTDDQLQHAVTRAFAQFGKVWIKIRRDARQMPFAFAQYENVEDARRAITLGRGMSINGRPCRTEVAKVNRSLYLSKISGGPILEAEARQVMNGFGPIQRVWLCSQTDREMYRLPEGIFIMFAFYDDCREAQTKFRDHPTHRLEQPKSIDDIRNHLGNRTHHSFSSPLSSRSPIYRFSPSSARRFADLCSIFVGNLPPQITEENLSSMFQTYGRIKHVEIIRKPSVVNATGVNAFAFIEYFASDCATLAVQASPIAIQGFRLRVERKETSSTSPRRPLFSGGSPSGQTLDSQEAMMIYQRGVSIGMTQAAQTQITPPPVYPQYSYYQPYDASLGQFAPVGTAIPIDAALNFQTNAASYMTQPIGQYQIPLAPTSFAHYQTAQPALAQNSIHFPAQNPSQGLRPYKWPLTENSIDTPLEIPAATNNEAN